MLCYILLVCNLSSKLLIDHLTNRQLKCDHLQGLKDLVGSQMQHGKANSIHTVQLTVNCGKFTVFLRSNNEGKKVADTVVNGKLQLAVGNPIVQDRNCLLINCRKQLFTILLLKG